MGYFGADLLIGSANSAPAIGAYSVAVTASIGSVTKNDTLGTWNWSLGTADGTAGPAAMITQRIWRGGLLVVVRPTL